jgi:hypothetical protein
MPASSLTWDNESILALTPSKSRKYAQRGRAYIDVVGRSPWGGSTRNGPRSRPASTQEISLPAKTLDQASGSTPVAVERGLEACTAATRAGARKRVTYGRSAQTQRAAIHQRYCLDMMTLRCSAAGIRCGSESSVVERDRLGRSGGVRQRVGPVRLESTGRCATATTGFAAAATRRARRGNLRRDAGRLESVGTCGLDLSRFVSAGVVLGTG